jgi:hypothetical protein
MYRLVVAETHITANSFSLNSKGCLTSGVVLRDFRLQSLCHEVWNAEEQESHALGFPRF